VADFIWRDTENEKPDRVDATAKRLGFALSSTLKDSLGIAVGTVPLIGAICISAYGRAHLHFFSAVARPLTPPSPSPVCTVPWLLLTCTCCCAGVGIGTIEIASSSPSPLSLGLACGGISLVGSPGGGVPRLFVGTTVPPSLAAAVDSLFHRQFEVEACGEYFLVANYCVIIVFRSVR